MVATGKDGDGSFIRGNTSGHGTIRVLVNIPRDLVLDLADEMGGA